MAVAIRDEKKEGTEMSARREERRGEGGKGELDEGKEETKERTLVLRPSPISEEFEKAKSRCMLGVARELMRYEEGAESQFVSSMEGGRVEVEVEEKGRRTS